jgi:GxxExxY protein
VDRDPRTFAVIGAAMRVHGELGPGYLEVTYQHALQLEFEASAIPHRREIPISVWYRGQRLGGVYRADFLCYDDVLVELKALPVVGRTEVRQLAHYLRATGHTTGLLLNFGADSLEFQRVRPRRSILAGPPSSDSGPSAQSQVPHTGNEGYNVPGVNVIPHAKQPPPKAKAPAPAMATLQSPGMAGTKTSPGDMA